jgi:G6PDH family F420-dependent oxidoreductase
MTQYGYSLMCEFHHPNDLVEQAKRAEAAGFDFVTISDHFHPWLYSHGHSPFAWSVLGAVAATTERIDLVSLVTAPIIRYHPAIVAQMAATTQAMSNNRFHLGVGAGENLNEHIVGEGWPPVETRHEMLIEAIEVMQELWEGGYVTHHGDHYDVEDARIFTLPDETVPIHVAVSGDKSIALAAEYGDGVIAVQPEAEFVEGFKEQSGKQDAPAFGQVGVSVMADADEALKVAHDRLRFMVPGWKVMAELPNPINFEAATSTVRPEDVAEKVPCGNDPEPILESLRSWTDAGFSHVALMQAPPDTEPFFDLWENELRPALDGS